MTNRYEIKEVLELVESIKETVGISGLDAFNLLLKWTNSESDNSNSDTKNKEYILNKEDAEVLLETVKIAKDVLNKRWVDSVSESVAKDIIEIPKGSKVIPAKEVEEHFKSIKENKYDKIKQLLELSIKNEVLIALKDESLLGHGKSKALDEKAKELGVKVIRKYNFNNDDVTIPLSEVKAGRFRLNTKLLVDECVDSHYIKKFQELGYVIIGGFHRIK